MEQKGALEIKVIDSGGEPVSGAEVWVWEKEKFGGNPQWTQATDQDGITLFSLLVGMYVVSLSPSKYYSSSEEAIQNVIYFEIKTDGETVERTLKLPEIFEQPDEATFKEYFSDMGLGKMPAGGKLPQDLQRNANIFVLGDKICIYCTVIQEVQISTLIYDLGSKKPVGKKQAYPKPLSKGRFAGCSPADLSAGKYEYKIYVGDVLIAIFPFEVR